MDNNKMTQQEIEEMINSLGNLSMLLGTSYGSIPKHLARGAVNNLIPKVSKLLEAYLSVMKSGIPKKKEVVDEFEGSLPDPISRFNAGYNQAIDDFTAYLAQKLERLIKELIIIKDSMRSNALEPDKIDCISGQLTKVIQKLQGKI